MSPPTSAQCLAHAGGKTEIFAGLVFVERFQCLCTFAQLAAWCRRLAPMAQNIFEDLSRKPVARTLRPAAAMTYLKLAFAVTHRSPIRSWDTASFRGPEIRLCHVRQMSARERNSCIARAAICCRSDALTISTQRITVRESPALSILRARVSAVTV